MILFAAVLATTVTALPPCRQVFDAIEGKLSTWSKGPRSISADFEEHNYHAVTKSGVTVKLSFVATYGAEVNLRELRGYEQADNCMFDGRPARLLMKKEVK